jgi:hypothetical protein
MRTRPGNQSFRESAKAFGKKTLSVIRNSFAVTSLFFFFFLSGPLRRERVRRLELDLTARKDRISFTQRAERSPVRWRSRTSQSGEANFARPQARIRGLKLCETSRCRTGNPQVSKATRTKDHAVTAMLPSPTHAAQTSLSFWPWPGPSLWLDQYLKMY